MVDIASLSIQVDATSVKQADAALDSMGVAAGNAQKATGGLSSSYKALRSSIDPAFKSQLGFNTAIDVLNNELSTGRITRQQYQSDLDAIRMRTDGTSKAFKLQKGALQQAGFQVQDFAVQVGSGTNALVAFGQQGSQLAGVFGRGGAVVGALIAVGSVLGGIIASSLSSTNEELEEFQERMKGVANTIDSIQLRQLSLDIDAQEKSLRELNKAFDDMDFDRLEELTGVEGGLFGASRADIIGAARLAISEGEAVRDKLLENKQELLDKDIELMGPTRELFDKEIQRQFKIKEDEAAKDLIRATKLAEDQRRLFSSTVEQLDPAFAQQERFFDQLDAIDSFNIAAQEKERLREEAFRQHQERMASIAGKGTSSVIAANETGFKGLTETQAAGLGATAQALGNFASIAEAGGQKSFNTYKRLAQAQAAISSTLAVLAVLGDATIQPTPLRLGLAFSIGALATAQVAQIQKQKFDGQRAFGGQVQAGRSFLVGEKGPELLTMGSQNGFITPNHRMPGQGGGDSAITIVNNTSAPIGTVTEQRISATERAIIIEEARSAVSRDVANPNSQLSRSLSRNTTARRSR